MLISDLNELPFHREIAVIINAGTKYVTTLALLSTLRFAQTPTLIIDCESRDGSHEWFKDLLLKYDFHLISAPLSHHGETLDWVFRNLASQRVLLVDSDVELLNDAMISRMRPMLDSSPSAYGSGYLHPAHWLDYHYWTDWPIAPGIGYYMERPWVPFALLKVEPVRFALSRGKSFMHRLVLNEVPFVPSLSRLLWLRFRLKFFRQHRLAWLDQVRGVFDDNRPSYVSYDTGAEIHEFLTRKHALRFETVETEFVPWSVCHLSGITRGSLHAGATGDAHKLADAQTVVMKRLIDIYGLEVPSPRD